MQLWLRFPVFALLGFLAHARDDLECDETPFKDGQATWGHNLNQGDKKWSAVRTPEECQEICRSRPECFVWKVTEKECEEFNIEGNESYVCYLKSSQAKADSSKKLWAHGQQPGVSGKICRKSDPDPSNFVDDALLLDGTTARAQYPGDASSCQDLVFQYGTTSPCGNDHKTCGEDGVQVSGWRECQQLCQMHTKCFVWTYFINLTSRQVQGAVCGRKYELGEQIHWCLLKTSEAQVMNGTLDQNLLSGFSGHVSGTGVCRPVQPLRGGFYSEPSFYVSCTLLLSLLVFFLPMPCLSGGRESMARLIWREIDRSRRLQDPAYAAISFDQLLRLQEKAKQKLGDSYQHATMHDINSEILQPLCDVLGKSYAHSVNREHDLKHVQVFVSHSWNENFHEFVTSIQTAFANWPVKPNLWICAAALMQSEDPSAVSAQVGTGIDPSAAPFTRAMAKAEKLFIVRNSNDDIYSRIWCCWELYTAQKLGLVEKPGSLIIAGPPSVDSHVDISAAAATNPEDKKKILEHLSKHGIGCDEINAVLASVKTFSARELLETGTSGTMLFV